MHRITQWGEYGIHVVLFLAQKYQDGHKIVGAGDISESQNLALNYTQQILLKLKADGLVESIRGPKGGYTLGRKATQISIFDILVAMEGDTISIICETNKIDHELCNKETNCGLKTVWYGLKGVIDSYLSGISVQQLLDQEIVSPVFENLVKLPVTLSQVGHG